MSSNQMRQLLESVSLNEAGYYNPDQTKQMIMDLTYFFGYLNQNLTDVKTLVNPINPRAKQMLKGPGFMTDYSNIWDILEPGKPVLGGTWGTEKFLILKNAEPKIDFGDCYIVFKVRDSSNNAFRMDIEYVVRGVLKEDPDTDVVIAYVNDKDKVILDGRELNAEERRQLFWG